ncbi:MAG: hypothetical protein FJ125_14370 [Deltaproteobacteria bacterium]|nr:hypothetical protein [Deltaproteobacteria bacterium]
MLSHRRAEDVHRCCREFWPASLVERLKAVSGRSAWSWKPAVGTPASDPAGQVTELQDYQQLDAGLTLSHADTYFVFLNAHNLLGQNLENLDDVHTIVDDEPVLRGGLRCDW